MMRLRFASWLLLALLGIGGAAARGQSFGDLDDSICGAEETPCAPTPAPPGADAGPGPGAAASIPGQRVPGIGATLVVFWGIGCPRCEEARVFLESVKPVYPALSVEWVEVRQDPAGRGRYLETMQKLGARAAGVPAFVLGQQVLIGFRHGPGEERLRRFVEAALEAGSNGTQAPREDAVELPLLGRLDWRGLPFPVFTLLIGLLDGLNPCAAWVLMVMLGLLLHVRSRRRIALFGGTFVVMSGVVYFLFMTAWAGLFTLLGETERLTRGLGVVLAVFGLVNLKELFWFRRGVSLMIPDSAKPGLFRRMRSVAAASRLPAAFAGIAALAFVVNLVELGCTIGLPAIFTRILWLRPELSPAARYGYLVLYNVAYVVPLGLIVAVYAATLHRFTLGERGAKALKALSGVLLLIFGLLFAFTPQILNG